MLPVHTKAMRKGFIVTTMAHRLSPGRACQRYRPRPGSVDAMTSAELPYGDPSATFRDDLFRRVNGAWLEGHVIPDDRAGDGAMRGLFDAAEENVRTIITDLQQADSDADPDTQMPADLYASFMDVDTIERLGVSPLREQFQAIADAGSKEELAAVMGRLEQEGVGGLLAGFVSADAKNSGRYALYFEQSLSLIHISEPTRREWLSRMPSSA